MVRQNKKKHIENKKEKKMFTTGSFLLFLSFVVIGWAVNLFQLKRDIKQESIEKKGLVTVTHGGEGPARKSILSIVELVFYIIILVDTLIVWFSHRPFFREEIIFMILFGIMILNLETIEFFSRKKKYLWDIISFVTAFIPLFFFLWRMSAFWPAIWLK